MELRTSTSDGVVIERFPAVVCTLLEQDRIKNASFRQAQIHPLQTAWSNVIEAEAKLTKQWLMIWHILLSSFQCIACEGVEADLTQVGSLL